MDIPGWSLLTIPDAISSVPPQSSSANGRSNDDRPDPNSTWWTSTVFDVCKPHIDSDIRDKHHLPVTYTSLKEVDERLSLSTESLPDWERVSDSDEFYQEHQCKSLPEFEALSSKPYLEQSNTIWHVKLDDAKHQETKDIKWKEKVISAWTNVTNGWVLKTATNFKHDSQIWLLGRNYACCKHPTEGRKSVLNELKLDFASRLWFTYRTDFSSLPGSELTSDVGWGCMIRSGQMMLAQAFILHFLGRRWRLSPNSSSELLHLQIIRYFGDFFTDDCPFSIHKLIDLSRSFGKQPGDWFGPASICVVFRDALEQIKMSGPSDLSCFAIYLTMDCTVYKQDVIDLCMETDPLPCPQIPKQNESQVGKAADDENRWRPLIILMPLRLGSETLNDVYIPCIKKLLEYDLCIGIIGGRPKHSLYFIGYQDDKLIYLDPHCCQKTTNVFRNEFPTETFHCSFPRKLSFNKMDPTCAIGFYCKSRNDFENLVTQLPGMIFQPMLAKSPLINFQEGRRIDAENNCFLVIEPKC